MCDTLGFLGSERSWFAKNSDRSPNEIQITECYPARSGLIGNLRATYQMVPQARKTNAVLLSRPAWMWGGEMGVNEHGVCIGNEAVFTKGAYGKDGLTGMDLVRLALERANTAEAALNTIIQLLEQFGQGGNCGYDHDFYYDNAFLIMDRSSLYVLETAGKEWVWKKTDRASISNRLSIGTDGDCYSGDASCNFKKLYTEPVYTLFSGSAQRRQQTGSCLQDAPGFATCAKALRTHRKGSSPFRSGSVSSACMHYGGAVGDHTTASMIVDLRPEQTVVWSTGTSLPCVSLFKPWLFGTDPTAPVFKPLDPEAKRYWLEAEQFRRTLIGKQLPQEYYSMRNAIESKWAEQAEVMSVSEFPAFSANCMREEARFFAHWKEQNLGPALASPLFLSRWKKKNESLQTFVEYEE